MADGSLPRLTHVEAGFSQLASSYQYVRDPDGYLDWNGIYLFARAAWEFAGACWETFLQVFRAFWAWAVGKDNLTDDRIAAFISS